MGPPDPRQRFEEIYVTYYPALMGYVRRRTGTPDDAADVLAETFLVAWRKVNDIPAGHEARLWLYGVARRVLAGRRREAVRHDDMAVRLRAELALWTEPPPDPDFDAVREAFGRLKDDDREVLSLTGWEGLNTAEIATVLGCSPGTARIRLHRARKRLARELGAGGLDLSRYGSRATTLGGGR
ncbi:RNA polymerase sigma factor [Microbispora sp. NPDC049125]|uniref:RNA polymerase sigma factor n=1 Tax=Microbispora sp. NPDC049125 TaxID=3154929 RepID=UPI0034653C66